MRRRWVCGRTAAASLALAAMLAGCASLTKKPVVVTPAPPPPVLVIKRPPPAIDSPRPPVKRACVPKSFPHAPRYPDTDSALRNAGGAADRYQLMAAGRVLRALRLAELERVVEGCR